MSSKKYFHSTIFQSSITQSLLALFIVTLCSFLCAFAQNETGTRNIGGYETMLKSRGKWYDSTTAMFQHQFPIIRSIPPLSITMPFNVLLSYIYTDSLLRFANGKTLKNRVSTWNTLNDTLKWMVYADYTMSDFNPIIYSQYWEETANWRISNSSIRTTNQFDTLPKFAGKYNASFNSIKPTLDVKIAEVLPNQSEAQAIMSLLTCNYILKIKVIAIDSMIDKLSANSFPGSYYYRVTAIVYDTIKGKVLPPQPSESSIRKNEKVLTTSGEQLIQFGYTNRAYHSLGVVGHEGIHRYSEPDSAFLRENGIDFSMKLDQDAIVFLNYFDNIIDITNDYFDLCLNPLASLNALPIIDGNVRDVNKVWSSSLLMDYSSWKNRANELITKILTRNY